MREYFHITEISDATGSKIGSELIRLIANQNIMVPSWQKLHISDPQWVKSALSTHNAFDAPPPWVQSSKASKQLYRIANLVSSRIVFPDLLRLTSLLANATTNTLQVSTRVWRCNLPNFPSLAKGSLWQQLIQVALLSVAGRKKKEGGGGGGGGTSSPTRFQILSRLMMGQWYFCVVLW